MASIVKDDKSIEPADDEERDHSDQTEVRTDKSKPPPPVATGTDQGGFFHIYKKGQGYWTRMGTAAAAALIAALTVGFLYQHIPAWLLPAFDHSAGITDAGAKTRELARATAITRNWTIGICTTVLLGWSLLVFWLMNKPANADFLIATDSEMKKVNWTSRKELIGSTKVVIIFMFLIAIMLFGFDIFFGYLFYWLRVLATPPF